MSFAPLGLSFFIVLRSTLIKKRVLEVLASLRERGNYKKEGLMPLLDTP
ncbi:hypothetical protein ES703_72478 [subsurface metagenome]